MRVMNGSRRSGGGGDGTAPLASQCVACTAHRDSDRFASERALCDSIGRGDIKAPASA